MSAGFYFLPVCYMNNSFKLVCVCVTSDLADVDGRHLCGADRRVTRRVGERLARPDGELLLLPGGHDLLGN